MAAPVAQRWALVLYNTAEANRIWHQRLVLGRWTCSEDEPYIVTPDFDTYRERLLSPIVDYAAVRVSGRRWPPPAAVPTSPSAATQSRWSSATGSLPRERHGAARPWVREPCSVTPRSE